MGHLSDDITQVMILDTNAYRTLVMGKSLDEVRIRAKELKKLDKQAGKFGIAHPIVIWELVAHLADKTDPHYGDCEKALVALAEHTWGGDDVGVCVLAQEAATACQILFRKELQQVPRWINDLCLLATHVRTFAPAISDQTATKNMQEFSTHMAQRERDWTSGMMSGVIPACAPEVISGIVGGNNPKETLKALRGKFADDAFMETWAAVTIVLPYAQEAGLLLSQMEVTEKAEQVKNLFPVSFHLMKDLLDKIATPDSLNVTNPNKNRWNFIWDSRIALAVGPSSKVWNADLCLVTADREIRNAAKTAGCEDKVITLPEYLRSVGLS